jgi:2,4-dienoyl-CoA reductase-like NADH-dependent reductase (Old Yellow Enzyme family)
MRCLFSAVRLGLFPLQHGAAMAPLTHSRFAETGDVPGDLMLEYYDKRASEGGFLPFERDGNVLSPHTHYNRSFVTNMAR